MLTLFLSTTCCELRDTICQTGIAVVNFSITILQEYLKNGNTQRFFFDKICQSLEFAIVQVSFKSRVEWFIQT